jgi:hypothetical protein
MRIIKSTKVGTFYRKFSRHPWNWTIQTLVKMHHYTNEPLMLCSISKFDCFCRHVVGERNLHTLTHTHTHIYIQTHIFIYAFTHTHLIYWPKTKKWLHEYIYTHTCLFVYTLTCMHICIYVCMYTCLYTYRCRHKYIYIHTCVYIYIYIYIHTHTHTHTHIYIYMRETCMSESEKAWKG